MSPLLSPQGKDAGQWACKGLETHLFLIAALLVRRCGKNGAGEHNDPVIAVALAGWCPSSERIWSNARVVWSAISALG